VRVLHVLDHSIPLHSGYTFRTLSILREQRRLGWETFHVTSPKQGAWAAREEAVEGLVFHRSDVPAPSAVPGLGEWALMRSLEHRLQGVAQRVRPDLIHAHSPVLNALPAIRVARRLGIPVVYEVRAFWEDAAVDHGTTIEGSLRYRLTRTLETYALRRVDQVFTICEGLRQDIIGRGIPESKVTVIPNAVDIEAFAPGGAPDSDLRAKLGLRAGPVLGFIGSFYAYEGLDVLLRALPRLKAVLPQLRLVLVGGGPQEHALKGEARRLGMEDTVVFTGRVPHDQVSRYYDLIDVLIYPRLSMRLTELVTPLKPLEAMAQGRLLIASDVGGHRELIRHGETGWLFRAGDAASLADGVEQMLAARERWPQMRTAARRFVECERNWCESVARYRPTYSRFVAA
jgi:PEP-CTERM/exosortase A-associated glycosyltransferase